MFGGLAPIDEFPKRPIRFSVKFVFVSHGLLMSISKMYLPWDEISHDHEPEWK
jgi:hypothetical protein